MVKLFSHSSGGQSFGCPQNAGAAGTIYDKSLETLKVSNGNFTTHTETPLLGFSVTKLWSNVLVESNAKVLVPLLWSRVQVWILWLTTNITFMTYLLINILYAFAQLILRLCCTVYFFSKKTYCTCITTLISRFSWSAFSQYCIYTALISNCFCKSMFPI